MSEELTNVNYDAVSPAPTGPDNPYDDALAFKSLLGAVHGEFNRMVNDNMVSESNTLTKINGKAILEKGVKEIMGQQRPVSQIPQQVEQQISQQQTAPQPAPQIQAVPQSAPLVQPAVDPNQLELNFDKSATVNEIFEKLEDIEIKLSNITKVLENLTSTKKKTLVKK